MTGLILFDSYYAENVRLLLTLLIKWEAAVMVGVI